MENVQAFEDVSPFDSFLDFPFPWVVFSEGQTKIIGNDPGEEIRQKQLRLCRHFHIGLPKGKSTNP